VRTLVVDGDLLVYEACTSVERAVEWSPGEFTMHADLDEAKAHIDSRLNKLVEDLSADDCVMALSDYTDPWRKIVMPSYKADRVEKRKPMVYWALREYVEGTRRSFSKPGLEGDDIVGILFTSDKIIPGERIVVYEDKDLLQLPGTHLRLNRMKAGPVANSLFVVEQAEGDHWHLMQTLAGDVTDGYKGIPGVGPKKAEKILAPAYQFPHGEGFDVAMAWPLVVAAYEKAGLTAEDALTTARIARICRASDWNFKTKEVRLWTPPVA
jgi:5''-3'' exonuclease (including N-terminal domain of PolI)